MEFQHKILQKYTLAGKIQYQDSPFFHDMVNDRDAKMISIFEVFAINRNEDDFLENLNFFSELVLNHGAAVGGSKAPVPKGPSAEEIAKKA